jgi:hypothetical protein
VAAVLVLVVRGQSREPELARLTGETSKGENVGLTLVDGRLESFDVYPSGWCRVERVRRSWLWARTVGTTVSEQEGSRFVVREHANVGVRGERVNWVAVMKGELQDSGGSARGTLHATWSYEGGSCQGSVRFSARRTP